jgi:hypothetical protein
MKNRITLMLIATVLVTGSFAQGFGLKGGLNLSKIRFESSFGGPKIENVPGISLGMVYDKSIGKSMAFETGLKVDQRGYKVSYQDGNQSSTGQLNLYYADIPLLFKKYFGKKDSRLFVQLGGDLGFGVFGNSKSETTKNGETETQNETVDWDKDNIARIDFGIDGGIGFNYKKLEVGVSYYYGMLSVDAGSSNSGSFNRTTAFSAAYFFNR